MEIPDAVLDRYRRVSVLADRGVGGEQVNAQRARSQMEDRYPGIRAVSARKAEEAERSDPRVAHQAANGNFGGGFQEKWSRWGKMAETAFNWAAGAAVEAASFEYARKCADHFVEVTSRHLPSGKVQVAARVDSHDLYKCASHLSDAQKHAFAHRVGEEVAEEILVALYPDE